MRTLNWSHAIIGFLIGVALILYLRGEKTESSSQSSYEVVEAQAE